MTDPEWQAARDVVLEHGWNAVAYQILNPGMRRWFSQDGDAVVGYVGFGRMRIVAGAPVCRDARLADVTRAFEADANGRGERVVFVCAQSRLERLLAGRPGHVVAQIGAQPVWDPACWAERAMGKASLRAQFNRARNKGVRIEEWAWHRAHRSPALQRVLGEWLSTRGLPPLHFLVEPDLLGTLQDRRVFVAEQGGVPVAFLVATPVPARDGWLVEQWPRAIAAPNGTTHLLVDAAMRAFGDAGARYATLGLAPLSDHGGGIDRSQPAWLRLVLHWMRAHGRRFYNFRGLDAFKASMQPMAWEPIYTIAQGTTFTPFVMRAIAGAFSGGSPERLALRALAHAASDELRGVRQALVR